MVRDLYAARDLGAARGSYTALVNGQDCAVPRLMPLKPSSHHEALRPWHSLLQQQLQTEREQAAAIAIRTTEGHSSKGDRSQAQWRSYSGAGAAEQDKQPQGQGTGTVGKDVPCMLDLAVTTWQVA